MDRHTDRRSDDEPGVMTIAHPEVWARVRRKKKQKKKKKKKNWKQLFMSFSFYIVRKSPLDF